MPSSASAGPATVLMVGTIEPRKGYDAALAAFEHLWSEMGEGAPSLMIVGKPDRQTDALQMRIRNHPEHGRRLHWLEEVSDEALAQFYRACDAALLASAGEGFGLPVRSALHRRWVLVRDLPVFREQRLPNLRYFTEDLPEGACRRRDSPTPGNGSRISASRRTAELVVVRRSVGGGNRLCWQG